ncbi:MAG: formate dehydrogenase subunit alpha [Candidatus Infernicultor aquiphilus]|uniref:nitrate reductase (cytochrome) n=1 Tax=Candidatus Infernicultor aquiphilus TaxID=1805029 RepID=A0A2M7PME0_9BACT|nr:MAG: formate dehydrogenase subunit alpha [Candidatus Atribacteria bacterium CG_4_10_14_3_um_filter_34_13]
MIEYKNVLTVCPYCGCGCNFYLQVLDGELVGILPCKSHLVSQGKLCIKGWNAADFVISKDRLTKPLMKKNGKFVEISWDEALKVVTEKLKQYSPDAVAVLSSAKCTNEENYLMMKFARAVLKTNSVDHCARLCHASTVVGLGKTFGSGAMTNSIGELEDADCIFVIGSNTTEQHPLIARYIMRARAKGAKLIVADPRLIPLTQFADYHLRQRPGTDVALLNGFMNVILKEGWEDKKFINERTEGFAELKEVVKKYTPEYVEKITGIPKELIMEAARIYAQAKSASLVYSMGITQHTTGVDNVVSCSNLALLTGNVGRPSTGVNPLRGQSNVQGACDVGALPNVYSGYQSVADENTHAKFEKAWDTELPSQPGLTVVEMMNEAAKGNLKAIYIMGENPMLSDPDIHQVKKALENLEFLVVQDIFLTETAQLADLVLPGTSYAERDGTFTATDRRVQRIRKAIEPRGESKPDWQIICALARKMGSKGFEYSSPAEIMDEIASVTPIDGGIGYERIEDIGLQWPCPSKEHPGTPYLHQGKFSRGKGKFFGIEFKEAAELPDADYPFILTTGRTIFHYHTGTMTRRTEALNREVPTGYVEINFKDAEKLNIFEGEIVSVKSRRGKIEVKVQVTRKVPEGVIFIPFHFAESPANALTNSAFDPVAKIPEYKVCAVQVEKKPSLP